ncbi:MAG: hypothetical protein IJS47_05530 [Clostridia bacterium]|nr:hypothetical protein [Clostridia bacterium]
MITLVKSESFKAFEDAYAKCFGRDYKADKEAELERDFIGRRMLKTQEDTIRLMNEKGFDTDSIVKFVDDVRAGRMYSREFITECKVKRICSCRLIDLINDIGYRRLKLTLDLAKNKPEHEVTSLDLLRKVILYTGVMVEVRINTYSLFGHHGDYDAWCRHDETAVLACEYFSELRDEYERRIMVCLKHSNEIDFENMDRIDFECMVEKILIGFTNGTIKPEKYSICDNLAYTYVVLRRLTTLIDGMCEWFWNED